MPLRVWTSASLALLSFVFACGSNESGGASLAAGQPSVGSGGGAGGAATGGTPNAGGKVSDSTTGGTVAVDGSAGTAPRGGDASGLAGSAGAASGGASAGGTGGVVNVGGAAAHAFKGVANSACADLGAGRLGAAWWYNWTLSPGSCKTTEFVPMIAGKAEKTVTAVQNALSQLKAAGYSTVLGFNEPNKADQANLTVAQVVDLWPALTADPAVRVSSPATSADAKAWFEDFMAQVDAKSLRVDFVALHWYGWNAGSCNDAKELEGYLTWAEKFKRPIWITEFGCMNQSNPTADVVQKFYAATVEMLGRHTSVERYAWYPWNTNNELVLTGNLTALGTAFGQAPAVR